MKTLSTITNWLDALLSEHCDWWQQEMIRETVDEMVETSGHRKPAYSEYFDFARTMKGQLH